MTHDIMYGGQPLAPLLVEDAGCTEVCPALTAKWREAGTAGKYTRWVGVIAHGDAEREIPDEALTSDARLVLAMWLVGLHP